MIGLRDLLQHLEPLAIVQDHALDRHPRNLRVAENAGLIGTDGRERD